MRAGNLAHMLKYCSSNVWQFPAELGCFRQCWLVMGGEQRDCAVWVLCVLDTGCSEVAQCTLANRCQKHLGFIMFDCCAFYKLYTVVKVFTTPAFSYATSRRECDPQFKKLGSIWKREGWRAHTALAEEPGVAPTIHIGWFTQPVTPALGVKWLWPPLRYLPTHAHIPTQTQTYRHIQIHRRAHRHTDTIKSETKI